MNTTHTNNLFDTINGLDTAARIPALRGIAHSTMAQCIGAIRQHIRDAARAAREEDAPQIDVDVRNQHDEDHRAADEVKEAMGFEVPMPPLLAASHLHAVYDWALSELKTLSVSRWDTPLDVRQMLEYMTEKARPLDAAFAQALADAARTDVKTIQRMHELEHLREKEQLKEARPEILFTFEGFGANGYEESILDLPKVTQHQLGVKVVEALGKARDQVLARVLRTRRISELASVPLIEDGVKQVKAWVEAFETRNAVEIREALDAGRNIRTLEDLPA